MLHVHIKKVQNQELRVGPHVTDKLRFQELDFDFSIYKIRTEIFALYLHKLFQRSKWDNTCKST